MWSSWANAFTPDEMDRIERYGNALPLAEAALAKDAATQARDSIRVTRTAWLEGIEENK